MNVLDIFIIIFIISSIFRGSQIGLVRQAGSSIGFVLGLLVGSWLAGHTTLHITDQFNRALFSLGVVLILSFTGMALGELAGTKLKVRLLAGRHLNRLDGLFGSVMSVATLLFAVWLSAGILVLSSNSGLQGIIKGSRIIAILNRNLPPATQVIGALNNLIDPNSFPQVFRGLEPHPKPYRAPASLGPLQSAVQADQASVVKIEGGGCGGIVEGSGFVIASDRVVTNAHVVAGVAQPQVLDSNGLHSSRVIWFDPQVDLAVLAVQHLAGQPLQFDTTTQPDGNLAAVLGYPGGGDFSAKPARIVDHFEASGRDIYGQGNTVREIYSIAAQVIPGNSGGPLIGPGGDVYGIVFATSTTYNDIGYVLTAQQVSGELTRAIHSSSTVGTGSCSE